MSKRLLSVFLVLCMLASVFGTVALASEPIYTTSPIFFGYVDGDAWTDATALEAGKTLTSKIEVSKTGDAENMIFALVVYDANKLISADSATKSVAGDTVEFETKVTLPADVAKTHVVAVLWDNVNDMNAIANSSVFPGGSADLAAIYVNGEVIANFDPDVKEYTYDLPTGGEEIAPVVTAKAADGGAKVEVGEATGFPGSVKIKVTAPGSTTANEYTVQYTLQGGQTGGFISGDPWIMTDNEIPQTYAGGGTVSGTDLPKFVEGGLTVDSLAYTDRQYKTTAIMDESLVGLDKIIGGINWYNSSAAVATAFKSNDVLPWVNFVLTRGATVMVFFADSETTAAPRFEQYGYEMESNPDGYFTNTLNNNTTMVHKFKFFRHYKAGETVTVPNAKQGNNTYTIVLSYDSYGYVAPINHTALSEIKVDGVAIEDFTEEIKAYGYELPAGQKDIPVIEVTTLDPNATVVVSNPTSFPGKSTITVKCEGYEDSVYVVNYAVKGTGNIKMLASYNDEEIDWKTTVPSMRENLQNGDKCWADRDNAAMVISGLDDSLKGNTYILSCLDWVNGSGNYKPVWASEEFIPNMYTFDLGRTATVSVLTGVAPTSGKGLAFAESGWTATKGDVPYAKAYITSAVNYTYKYSKEIEVTDTPVTVEMPNLGSTPYLVVIEYATYESLEGITPDMIPSTELTTLALDGVEIEGFSAAKTEYNVALTTQQIPTVSASALYKDAVVTVSQATDLPGTATVTVEAEGLETATYTINFTIQLPDGYVEGMSISNDNIEIRTTKRTGWNAPLNKDSYNYVYKKTVDVEEGSNKTITLEIANKPYQKGTIILRPTAADLEDKTVLVNADGSAIEWIDDTSVSRAYDYTNYPEYNVAGVTYGKKSKTNAVTLGSGKQMTAFKEMFADDNRYVSGARTHYTRYPISGGTAMGDILPEWENCNYIVFYNYYGDDTQLASETVTFTVDKDVEIIFLTSANNVTVKEVGVDETGWTAEAVSGINRIYINWIDSITVAYLIYNGYITAADLVGTYGNIQGVNGILMRDRSAFEEFMADWKAATGETPTHGVQIKEADKATTGFVNDSATYHHDVFLYAWKEATGGEPVVPPATAGATELIALSVDGTAVSGFAANTYDYTVAIPDNQADFPEVTYTKADEGATATVTNPTEFPGKTVITVSKSGEETKTYTITYKTATEGVLVSDLKLTDKAGINSTSSVWPTTATNLQEGDLLYLGRNYKVTTINDESAKGKDRIMTAVGWGSDVSNNYSVVFRGELINDWISFKALRGMDVVIYDDNASDATKFTNLGYAHTTDSNCYIYAQLNQTGTGYNEAKHTHKYVKHYAEGESVQIPNASANQAYLVVLDYDNYASLEEDEPTEPVSTLLSGITVNGTAIAGFASETYSYDVELPAGTATAVVAATVQDSAANVAITQAAAIPGTATITVTAEGSESTTYTINITKEITDEDIYGKAELTITDNDVEPRAAKRGATWNAVIGVTNFTNKYAKEYTVEEGGTKTISLDITGLANQQGLIIVVPTGDGADKTAIVNADGSALSWTDDKRGNSVVSHGGTIESYDYDNYPEYTEAGATWAKISSNKPVTVTYDGSAVSFPVMQKLIETDGKYVNGSRAQTDRRPADAAVHYTDLDDSWLGSNYIVFDNTSRASGFTVEFTINQSAEIILVSNNAGVTVKETGSDDAWTKASTSVVREHCSPIDELTVAYMIYHGFLNENQFTDVSTYTDDTTGTKLTGRRIKNISAFREFQADLVAKYGYGSAFGIAIVETNREATGFTEAGKDYHYKDYLYNWEEAEVVQPTEPVSTLLSGITVNGAAVEGFDAATLTYSVELAAGTTTATVAATTADEDATATVTQAASIPGTATIVVTGEGSESTTYTVNITVMAPVSTDPVQNVTMKESNNGTTLNWGNAIAVYKTNLQVDDYCYSDRSGAMKWTKVADEFQGKDWIQGALNWPNGGTNEYSLMWKQADVVDYYTFELHKSAEVSIITNSTSRKDYLLENGWAYESDVNNGYLMGYTNTAVAYCYKFSKYFDASDGFVTVAIPNVNGVSCTVIIDYDATPYASTLLSDLTVDGVTVKDFAPADNTYTVGIVAGSELPVVGYTLADNNASAVVVQAEEVPGTATVTVSGYAGQEDNVYTINFIEVIEKKISFDDLEARGANTHTEGTTAVMYNATADAKYAYSKTYEVLEGETKTITLSAAGLTNQYSSIVVIPTEDDADKNVIVTADGSELTWRDYKTGVTGVNGTSVSAYDYQNGGDEEFDASLATYTQFSTDGVSVKVDGSAKTAWVVDKMHYSDDAFVNGAPAVTDRNPSQSGVCWVEFPAEWEDCNYITFASGSIPGSTGAEITFTVNAPVKVVVLTANASAQVKDSEDTENWAKEDVSTIRRYMHGVDQLSVAYMIKKGYMKESDITRTGVAFAGYVAADNVGVYLRRYDALMKMKEDMGANYGVGIKADALEGTGFVNLGEDAIDYYIRDYNYQDFLDAWVDDEPLE